MCIKISKSVKLLENFLETQAQIIFAWSILTSCTMWNSKGQELGAGEPMIRPKVDTQLWAPMRIRDGNYSAFFRSSFKQSGVSKGSSNFQVLIGYSTWYILNRSSIEYDFMVPRSLNHFWFSFSVLIPFVQIFFCDGIFLISGNSTLQFRNNLSLSRKEFCCKLT